MSPASQNQQSRTGQCSGSQEGRAVSRLAGWSGDQWSHVKELVSLLESAQEEGEKKEIVKTLLEVLFPNSIGGVGDFEGDPGEEARQRLEAYRKRVGQVIRQRRESLRMTQEQLAERAGIPQSHVSRLERGKHAPTQETIEKVATALQTTPSQIDPGCEDAEAGGEA
jgi:DNA-binding XRE family transcriptional regulator